MKTIYFVRHGETEANMAKIVSGSGSDTPLTKKGRQQAKKAGEDLKGKGIELVVCSPLGRTVETANIIAEEIGYDTQKIVQNPLLVERTCGIYEGGPEDIYLDHQANGKLHFSVETTEQMYERLTKALESLKSYKENRILVVSHGGASRAIRAINQKLHHTRIYEIEKIGNAEIYEFEL
jgi:broad specificity phosphatase PhoE